MDFAESMFMAEAEGYLPTRTGKINAIVKAIKNYPSPVIDQSVFESIVNHYGINPQSLTRRELNYINSAIK